MRQNDWASSGSIIASMIAGGSEEGVFSSLTTAATSQQPTLVWMLDPSLGITCIPACACMVSSALLCSMFWLSLALLGGTQGLWLVLACPHDVVLLLCGFCIPKSALRGVAAEPDSLQQLGVDLLGAARLLMWLYVVASLGRILEWLRIYATNI